MHAPQIICVSLIMLDLGVTMARHGQPKPKFDIWVGLFNTAVAIGLLYWGGFFAT